MPTRQFTRDELADLGVPLDDLADLQYSETVLADIPVTTLKYSEQRRCVFRTDDDKTYAVTYERQIDAGDYEVGPPPDDHGWYGRTIPGEEVERRPVVVQQWEPVTDEPGLQGGTRPVLDDLIGMYEEAGVQTRDARQYAAQWLIGHAEELASLARPRAYREAADAIEERQTQLDAEIRADYSELDRDTEVEGAATRRMAAMLREKAEDTQ